MADWDIRCWREGTAYIWENRHGDLHRSVDSVIRFNDMPVDEAARWKALCQKHPRIDFLTVPPERAVTIRTLIINQGSQTWN